MALPLSGRVAIVTGSSRGIGRAIASPLASLGANLVINYARSSTHADLLVSELNSNSPTLRAIAVQADISDPSGPKKLFNRAEQAFGTPVHIFVNSAGIIDTKNTTISSTSIEDFDATFNVNARGAFLCCREASNRITRGGGGRIVMISSSFGCSCQISVHIRRQRLQWRRYKDTGEGAQRAKDYRKLCSARGDYHRHVL